MTSITQTLLDRAAAYFGDDVTWILPDAEAGLRKFAKLNALHPFRPAFLALQNMKVAVSPEWPAHTGATAVLNLPRQAEWACGLMAQALEKMPEGGTMLMIAPNDLGGKRYAKLLDENFDVIFAESKNHCRIAAIARPAVLPDIVQKWKDAARAQLVAGADLLSLPGTFSHGRVDTGSALLLQHLPAIGGHVADFGGGWGYLSQHLMKTARVDLFEADYNALAMAKRNLGDKVQYYWHDILTEKPSAKYDVVVMNPPFHDLADANPEIGRGFIERAAESLKNGGQLWMVANTHLPYEEILKNAFKTVTPVVREKGFKVLCAVK
ncbi:MAG: class I SAM-dependent methyltransferase [Alphaproteobacteria bacterium]|nr:class I SAM-dependent methyltransferase [Alphaproteobacteria bacterium]